MHIKIGTRSSKLALWQADYIADLLQKEGCTTELVTFETKGDKILDKSLSKIGSKGLFTQELEDSLRSGETDIAVHSAKDMQSSFPEDLEIIAFTEREQNNDVLVSFHQNITIDDDIIIGTSSTRRRALLKNHKPDVKLAEMRGNLQTRLKKMENGDCDAMILAFAGVHRMGYDNYIAQHLPVESFIPPVGQGAVAVQICNTNLQNDKKELIRKACNNIDSELCLLAERKYLEILDGGCSVPVFAHAQLKENTISIEGGIVSLDGKTKIKFQVTNNDPIKLGAELAEKVIAAGGKNILEQIKAELSS